MKNYENYPQYIVMKVMMNSAEHLIEETILGWVFE